MTSSFLHEVNTRGLDTDSIHHALRYYLAERLDDLPPEDMLNEMYRAAIPGDVDNALALLLQDSRLVENGALLTLSAAWSDASERARLKGVLAETKNRLPIIEVATLAIACMYGLYLLTTGGLRRSETTVIRRMDRSKMTETKEYVDPGRSLRAVTDLFRPTRKPQIPGDDTSTSDL